MLNRKCGLWELIVFCFIVSLFSASGKAQDSVADAARKNLPKDAQAATKRVWADDDFPATGAKESTAPVEKTQESASEILRKFQLKDKEGLGKAVLKRANAPNVDFPERKEWESMGTFQTLFILHLANGFVLLICFFSLGIKNPWKWFQQTRMKNMTRRLI
jgi:hypothetical protein